MASERTRESKEAREAETQEKERVVYECKACGAFGQLRVGEQLVCILCFNIVEPFKGYRRENDEAA